MRSPRGRIAENYFQQFWRSRRRSEAEKHQVIQREDGSFEIPTLPVSSRKLARHGQLYGVRGVEDFLATCSRSETSDSCPAIPVSTRGVSSRSFTSVVEVKEPWNSTKTRNLGLRVVSLRKLGLGPMAIADAVGKSDRVVQRYLAEAEQAGLLAESG
jgi:hypothetical protein